MSTVNYYVYYKVDAARAAGLRTAVDVIFHDVQAATGIRGDLQRRRDDPSTYMETYLGVADAPGFERALAAAVAKSGFEKVAAHRVTEIFESA